jgi:3D (Asp-Asp-Asp) domain-containing protein
MGSKITLGKHEIILIEQGKSVAIKTGAKTVKELIEERKIIINENDQVIPGIETALTDGMSIEIKRAKSVEIIADGKNITLNTTAHLVKEVLDEAGVALGQHDKVIPGLQEAADSQIKVIRVTNKNLTEQKDIPYEIERKPEESLYKGEQRVLQKGKPGLEKYVYEVVLEDGKEVARKLIQKIVVREPVKEVVAMGNRQTVSRGGKTLEFERVLNMVATGYTHTGNRTYTDIWPSVGVVAVDPNVIPLGTRLYIEGYGYATALDIGSSIKGNRIDLFFETKAQAWKWGRRTVQVFVLQKG